MSCMNASAKPTEETTRYAIKAYVTPARERGESTVHIRVGQIQKELGWTNRTPSVFSTLKSQPFQLEAGVELVEKRGGPPSGGPSTTVEFVYRVLDAPSVPVEPKKPIPSGQGLEELYGIFRDVYASFGGGEAYLKAERNWGPDVWERYEQEERARKRNHE
jgi:hypothetical protein